MNNRKLQGFCSPHAQEGFLKSKTCYTKTQLIQIAKNFNPPVFNSPVEYEEQRPEGEDTADAGEADAGQADNGATSARGARGTSKRSDDIKQKRRKEQNYNDYLSKQLEQLDKNRAANRAEMEKLLKAIRQKQSQTESICDRIAYRFLTENDMLDILVTFVI